MNTAAVQDLVGGWVQGVVGVTTIDAWPNAAAPAEPYVCVTRTISDDVREHPAGEDFIQEGGVFRQVPIVEIYWRFSLDAFGQNAEDVLRRVKTASNVPTAMWPLRPLLLVDTSRILTANEIRDQSFHGRAQMTIEVRGIVRDGLVVDVIEEQTPVLTPVA